MAMQIHLFQEIPSDYETSEGDIVDTLLDRQNGKFIISKEETNRLFIFPFWCKHAEVMRKKIEDLGVADFHGAGVVRVTRISQPINPAFIGMVYDSETMRQDYKRDRPTDAELADALIREAEQLIADVLTSIKERRDVNETWSPRNYDANHKKQAKM